ncbi:MAG TPA: metallophosphoesterase [Rhodospirillales bacterium]|nr:metallophosphoesterase [Rhodospirillales bacterium]
MSGRALRLAHLSDVHLAPMPPARPRTLVNKRIMGWLSWNLKRHRLHRRAILDAVVADVRAQGPDHVLVTGDLVNISLPEEYVRAAEWLAALGPPEVVSVVPGNHDAYVAGAADRGWRHWAAWMRGDAAAEPVFPYLRRRGFVAILGLSTAVPSPPGYASGRLGDAQLRDLEARLRHLGDAGLFRIVLLHHPPLPASPSRKALEDRKAFRAVIRKAGAELVLSGHEHRFCEGFLAGLEGQVPVFVAPSASHGGEIPAKRAGYLLVEIAERDDGWQLAVRLRRLAEGGGFTEELGRQLRLPRGKAALPVERLVGEAP